MATTWLAPGARAISEFARQHTGVYLHATCVETATYEAALAQDPSAYTLQPGQIGDYLQAMVNDWRAHDPGVSLQGASNFGDATRWLRARGFRVDEDVFDANWWKTLQDGLRNHQVFIVGVTNAQGLPGDEQGVHNHGLAAVGIDASGNIICGDPDNWKAQVNMPGNPIGVFVTYTQQDFLNGSISSLTRVYPRMLNIQDVSTYFTEVSPTEWKCNVTGKTISMGLLEDYRANNGLAEYGLPLTDAFYDQLPQGVAAQDFERRIRVYDPDRKFDSPPGAIGACYNGHMQDARINRTLPPPKTDPKAKPAEALADAVVALAPQIEAYKAAH